MVAFLDRLTAALERDPTTVVLPVAFLWGNGFGAIAQGVGFLGAGLILKEGATVHGVSTAATLWCVAAAGAAAGAREITAALTVTLLVLAVNLVLRPVRDWAHRRRRPDPSDPD